MIKALIGKKTLFVSAKYMITKYNLFLYKILKNIKIGTSPKFKTMSIKVDSL